MVGLGVALLVGAVVTELTVKEPIIPMRLFRDRTTSLATFASIMVGVAMFGSTVFLSQYFQIARGMSPTHAGLMTIAMVGGLLFSSIVSGRLITARGRWKRFLVGGMVLVIVGMALLSTIERDTPLAVVGVYMAVLGIGMGATMQNLVLSVQNNTAQADMGAASSLVAFFRTMGGAIGVSALGTALGHQVSEGVTTGLRQLGITPPAGGGSASIPDMSALPEPVRLVFEHAFGDATGHIFLLATPFAVLAFVAVLFIREVPLRTTIEREDEPAPAPGR
jgi:predicted MFS family arabinose efflux permease